MTNGGTADHTLAMRTTTSFETETNSMATSTPQMTDLVANQPYARQLSPPPEKGVLIVGAIAAGTGVVLQLILEHLHPHHAQPNNSVAAFSEYAHAHGWAAIHIG